MEDRLSKVGLIVSLSRTNNSPVIQGTSDSLWLRSIRRPPISHVIRDILHIVIPSEHAAVFEVKSKLGKVAELVAILG